MPLHRVITGQAATAEGVFEDADQNPIQGTGPATFTIVDFDGNVVVATTPASQSLSDPALWTGAFTIPTSAPISTLGKRYRINWTLPLAEGTAVFGEAFEVIKSGDPTGERVRTDLLLLAGRPLIDTLYVETTLAALPKFYILDMSMNVAVDEGVTALSGTTDGQVVYKATVGNTINRLPIRAEDGLTPYMAIWEYELDGVPQQEAHPIYVIDAYMLSMIVRLRGLIDRGRQGRIHRVLEYTDADLMFYVLRGLERFNATGQHTKFSLPGLPRQAVDPVIKAAAVEALRAQYLAEALHTFDFQGNQVQLNVDMTQYLDNILQGIEGGWEAFVERWKLQWVKYGGSVYGAVPGTDGQQMRQDGGFAMTHLRVTVGPGSNIPTHGQYAYSYGLFMGGILPMYYGYGF